MSNGKVAVVMQPTFLPWLGWFDLADQVNEVILLDDVEFSKQSWQQRNRIRTRLGLQYVSVPVVTSGRLGQLICEAQIHGDYFESKTIKTINHNYSKSKYFECFFEPFCEVLRICAATRNLADLNCGLIRWLMASLGLDVPVVMASALAVDGERGWRVASLCRSVSAVQYLSTAGAEQYLFEDRRAFEHAAIEVLIHRYDHPEYGQCYEPFMPYASVLDLLFNEGPGAMSVIRSGRRPARFLIQRD